MSYLVLTIFVYGLHRVFWNVAEFFGVDLETIYGIKMPKSLCSQSEPRPAWQKFILKPLFYCNVCMSSFWGTFCYFGLMQQTDPYQWVLHCVISAGLIHLINEYFHA